MKNIFSTIALCTLGLSPTLAQHSPSKPDKQTKEFFKELCTCLEEKPDTLKYSCFDNIELYPEKTQEKLLHTNYKDILKYSTSEKKLAKTQTSLNAEIIEIFQAMNLLFNQVSEVQKKEDLTIECESIITDTYDMRNK